MIPKCGHSYYDRTALQDMCDINCSPCAGYKEDCTTPAEIGEQPRNYSEQPGDLL